MTWATTKGFNFRNTSGYVADGADEVYVGPGTAYPTTTVIGGDSVTYGWESAPAGANDDTTSSPASPELSGSNYNTPSTSSTAIFRVDLPTAGQYGLRVAAGDYSSGATLSSDWAVYDTTSAVYSPAENSNLGAQHYIDASNNFYTSAAAWQSGNVENALTFATTIFRFYLKFDGSTYPVLAHLQLRYVQPPVWISINSATGVLSGTAPSDNEIDTMLIQLQDSSGKIAQKTFQLLVGSFINPMFINFAAGGSGTTYYEGFPIFKNRVREGFGPWTSVNAQGWPNANFYFVPWSAGTGSTSQASWVNGNWSCGFIGTGSETITSRGGTTISNIVPGTGGAYTTFTMSGVTANAGFNVGNVSGAVTNIFAYLPEYNALNTIDNPLAASAFTTEAIAHYKQYGAIRFMDWANVIRNAATMTSSNRATPSNTQCAYSISNAEGSGPGILGTNEGVPLEWCAAFCLACGCGMWLSLPNLYDGTFTYATSLANALYALVPAGVPIYLEISDELWNSAGAGIVAWNSAASSYGSQVSYYSYQAHNIAAAFRAVFGARYGTDVRFMFAWQSTGNGVYFKSEVFAYYIAQGWSITADFWGTSIAPYMNLSGPSNSWTIAQIESNLSTVGAGQAFASFLESCTIMGLKYGFPMICYEGGWQVNNENSGLTNGGAAVMDTGMTGVMETFYQAMANSGAYAFATYSGGVNSNQAFGTGLPPTDELSYSWSLLTASGSPRFAAIQSFMGGWASQRNVVSGSGSVIQGNCYRDSSSGAAPTLTNFANATQAPNYGVNGQVAYLVNCPKSGTYTLVVNFTNGGSAGLTGCEYAGNFSQYTVLPANVTIPVGTNNVTIGAIALVQGANYVALGNPGTNYPSITINTLTFN